MAGKHSHTLSRRVADAIAVGWSAVMSFKLHEVTNFHLDTESGHFMAFMFMNKDSYARLPEPAKRAIDRHSGEPFFKLMAEVTARQEREGREAVTGMAGHTIEALAPEEAERWKHVAQPIIDEWLERTPNGEAILAAFREEIENIRGGM